MNVNAQGLPLFGSLILKNCFYNSKEEEQFTAIQLILMRAMEAFTALNNKDLSQFDALVGDQACQIRALKIIMLCSEDFDLEIQAIRSCYNKLLGMISVRNSELNRLDLAITTLSKNLRDLYPLDQQKFLKEFNDKKKGFESEKRKLNNNFSSDRKNFIGSIKASDINVSQNTLFLLRSYFLTLTKTTKAEYNYPTAIDPLKFESGSLKSRNILIGSLFKNMQFELSLQSVDFVQNLGRKLNYESMNCLVETTVEKAVVLPFFYMTEVIFLSALEMDIPIFLKIKNINENTFQRKMLFAVNANSQTTGIIIEAFSSSSSDEIKSDRFKQIMFEEGVNILNMINYNAAQHDGTPEDLSSEAINKGFSKFNSKIFCITHVFADLLIRQIEEIS